MAGSSKDTAELLQDLKKTAHIEDYLRKNADDLRHESQTDAINRIYRQQGRGKAEIAREAGISDIYLYQIFSGKRIPSRNRLICICLGMRTFGEDAQMLLRLYGYAPLYVRDERDAIILHGILHGKTVPEVNRLLLEKQLAPLLD